MRLRNKGYLMIDLVFASTLSIILFWSVLSLYDFYYVNKKKCDIQLKANDILRAISLELKNNVSFDFINGLNKEQEYFLDIENMQDLMENDFENLLNLGFNNENEFWSLNIFPLDIDNILSIEIKYRNYYGKTKYEFMEVVKKFSSIN